MYVYLREAFSPLLGFLYGWTLLTVIQTGTIAAVAIAFARFSGGCFRPSARAIISVAPMHLLPGYALSLSTAQALALGIIVFIALLTRYGVNWGKLIQNIFTVAKLAGMVRCWPWAACRLPASLRPARELRGTLVSGQRLGDSWLRCHHRLRTLRCPLRLADRLALLRRFMARHHLYRGRGTKPQAQPAPRARYRHMLVIGLYLLCNLCYLAALPVHAIQTAPNDRVATLVVDTVLPGIGRAMAHPHHGLHLRNGECADAGRRPRLLRHGAGWPLLPSRRGSEQGTRARDGRWRCNVCGRRSWCCRAPTIASQEPTATSTATCSTTSSPRRCSSTSSPSPACFACAHAAGCEPPVSRWGYPWLPAIYIAGAAYLAVLFVYRTTTTWPGLLIIASGLPIYFAVRRRNVTAAPPPLPYRRLVCK